MPTLPNIVVRTLLEADVEDEEDPKSYVIFNSKVLPKEISIVGRRWNRNLYGNTYNTASITVDGKYLHTTARENGYGDGYLEAGWRWLEDHGIVPERKRGEYCSPSWAARDLGISLEYYPIDVKRQRDL